MSAASWTFYNSFFVDLLNGNIDLASDTIKLMLVESTYTPDVDAHDFLDDVRADETAGVGYAADGETLGGKAITQDDVNDRAVFAADDVTWTTATVTFRYAVLYKVGLADASSPLIGYLDFAADQVHAAQDVKIDWNASGVFALGS